MGMLDNVLAGVSGGLGSGLKTYSWQKEMEQKQRALESNSEIQRLRQEIALQIAEMNGQRARDVATIAGTSRENVAEAGVRARTEASRLGAAARAATDEANKFIAGANNTSRETIASGVQAGQDRRWGKASGNALVSAATARRGQDKTAETADDRLDVMESLGWSNIGAKLFETQQQTEREKIRRQGGSGGYSLGGDATTEQVEGTGRATATPKEVREPSVVPLPKSDGADADQQQQLAAQIQAALQRFQNATTTSAKLAAQQELIRLRARVRR